MTTAQNYTSRAVYTVAVEEGVRAVSHAGPFHKLHTTVAVAAAAAAVVAAVLVVKGH